MADFIGYAVSVACGSPLGCYQGTILQADGATITLTKAFRNGFPYPKSTVTLNASDIKELSIISARASPPAASTVARAPKACARARATVCETLQATPSAGPGALQTAKPGARLQAARPGPTRSKPIDIQGNTNRNHKNNNSAGYSQPGSGGAAGSAPRSRGGGGGTVGGGGGPERARRRNEACFGSAADAELEGEFDFEKNLALFDKQALWQQMRSTKPDLVRQTEGACGKFRHDENVVGGAGAAAVLARRPVIVPFHAAAPLLYVTDEGVVVPSVAGWVRRALWAALRAAALLDDAALLLARAAADVAVRLVGGGRRLDPANAHQPPAVVLLHGTHRIGACGLTVGRLLCSHGARVTALCARTHTHAHTDTDAVERARTHARAAGVTEARSTSDLPPADLVIIATHDPFDGPDTDESEDCTPCPLLTWAASARGALLGLEPPPRGFPGLELRASVAALLPAAGTAALGRLHLADVAPPPHIFTALGLSYRPPFGAWSALPLHIRDDADD